MASEKLRVIARLKSRPELENQDDPTEFTFTEEWIDAAALAEHFETEHIKSALARFPDLLAEELDLRRYSLVG